MKKYWAPSTTNNAGIVVPSTTTTKQDFCIKCHVTCRQCVDENLLSCVQCFDRFVLRDLTFDDHCIECLSQAKDNSTVPDVCARCLMMHSNKTIQSNENCTSCLSKKNRKFTQGDNCQQCWLSTGLANGRCVSDPLYGYYFYGNDVNDGIIQRSSWRGYSDNQSVKLKKMNCTTNYEEIWGIPHSSTTNNQKIQSLEWSQTNFPPHRGMIIMFNIIKVNNWEIAGKNKNYINIRLISDNNELTNQNQTVNNSVGSNICGGPGN